MSHLINSTDPYWQGYLKSFGVDESCKKTLCCIKSNGDLRLEIFTEDDGVKHVTGLASRPFLINLLSQLGMPVENHVLEINIETSRGQIPIITYVCAVDRRILEINWDETVIFLGDLR